MTTIAQGPTRRFSSIIVRTDDATPGQSFNVLPIDQDIVAHSVAMCIGFTCPAATFALAGVGVVAGSGAWGDDVVNSMFLSMTWSNLHATVPRTTGSFNQSIELGGMIIPAGQRLVVTRVTNQSAGATSSAVGTVTLCFSTLSEWQSFMTRR